jgi:hypothetical protein
MLQYLRVQSYQSLLLSVACWVPSAALDQWHDMHRNSTTSKAATSYSLRYANIHTLYAAGCANVNDGHTAYIAPPASVAGTKSCPLHMLTNASTVLGAASRHSPSCS